MIRHILGISRIIFWSIFFRQRNLLRFVRAYRSAKELNLFDHSYYRTQLSKKLPNWIDPLAHCLAKEITTFCSPHILFDENYYLAQSPKTSKSKINPLMHFVLEGITNNQSPHSLIDVDFYSRGHPDVAAKSNGSVLPHFFKYGVNEGRRTHTLFDPEYYQKNNLDVAESGVNPLVHFLEKGGLEGRNTSTQFDSSFYLTENRDVRTHGVNPLVHFLKIGVYEGRLPFDVYPDWINLHEKPMNTDDTDRILRQSRSTPLVSIIMPVFNTGAQWLRQAIDSVLAQTYPHWELCIADDASTSKAIRPILEEYKKQDSRINVVYRSESGHISAASNSALGLASGDFIGLLDHDDELHPDALLEVALMIYQHDDADLIYSDEDKITPTGIRFNPFFKPDWAPERLLSHMYCGHLGIYRTTIVRQIGGFREGYHGSQDYDLCLRFTEQSDKVYHIPKILYHWRTLQESTAINPDSKSYAYDAAERALQDALERRTSGARVMPVSRKAAPGLFRVKYRLEGLPKVSVVIIDRYVGTSVDQIVDTVRSLILKTAYKNLEVIICVPSAKFKDFRTIQFDQVLNSASEIIISPSETDHVSSMLNAGVSKTTGSFFALFDPQLKMCTSRWIQTMVSRAQQPRVGVIGPKLITHDNFLHSGGLILREDQAPMHSHQNHPKRSWGYFGQLAVAGNSSALSSHCFLVSRDIFEQFGKFDEDLSPPWVEADFCLRLSQAGYRHVLEPDVIAKFRDPHGLDNDRDPDIEDKCLSIMSQRWSTAMANDPLYSPHLMREFGGYRLNNYPKALLPLVRTWVSAEHC